MAKRKVKINRAPVLTLWATIVAERLGYDHDTALTLGKAVAGLNAQSKGRRLGLFEEAKRSDDQSESKAQRPERQVMITLLGRPVPTVHTTQGVRATVNGKPIEPTSVQRYLELKFGEDLGDVQNALESLAAAYPGERLSALAYSLYEKFRPQIPEGEKGWGAKGELNLGYIRSLAK